MIDGHDFFEVIVAGNNPEELMKKYDKSVEVEPYIVYKKSDADYLKAQHLKYYNEALENKNISDVQREEIEDLAHDLLMESSDEFFSILTDDYEHDEDGNAISTDNPDGKWAFYQGGKLFSVPFITKDGRELFQCKKGDIDWRSMHLSGGRIYKRAWEMVMEGSKPTDGQEEHIYENMKNRTAYFSNFNSKEDYVMYNISFWAYAFLSEDTGWEEYEEEIKQIDWVKNFYDKFIKPLPDDTLLTIYECKK